MIVIYFYSFMDCIALCYIIAIFFILYCSYMSLWVWSNRQNRKKFPPLTYSFPLFQHVFVSKILFLLWQYCEVYRGTSVVHICLCCSCEFYLPTSNSILNQENRWNPSLHHILATFLSQNSGTIFVPHVLNTLSTFNIIHGSLFLHMTNIDWELQFIFYEHLEGRLFKNPARRRKTLQRHSIKWNFCWGRKKVEQA